MHFWVEKEHMSRKAGMYVSNFEARFREKIYFLKKKKKERKLREKYTR